MLKMVLLAILSRYFLCSDSFRKRACLWLRICAEDPGIRFGFRRLVCTFFGKALRMLGCEIDFGSCSFRESQEKSREKSGSTVAGVGELGSRGWEGTCFSLIAGSTHRGRRDSHGAVWYLMDGNDVCVIDIYSCDRP